MKIAIFGATGNLGTTITREALTRGHSVTGLARHPERSELSHRNLTLLQADILDPQKVATAVAGHDAVISAYAPAFETPETLSLAARCLLTGLAAAQVRRLLIVGGAGSLQVAPDLDLLDSPEFPPSWRPIASAHRDALNIYRQDTALDWTYFSPAAMISPGSRTEHYRIGGNKLLTDAEGKSIISNEDFAVAILDELESPNFIRKRITVAY